ncbi:hypothetical protein BDV28DRAFT_39831 [Aspergillus coremiiformis]|uniref:Uncharacterized protein n=1 Tax=Aspergillus coremiiformis TaxID=138285 RepID=A0A5N6YYB9_9EURO|nr:hypothetical protein BDV28DRAFT_39831 [Aspergillus coremiiformis]
MSHTPGVSHRLLWVGDTPQRVSYLNFHSQLNHVLRFLDYLVSHLIDVLIASFPQLSWRRKTLLPPQRGIGVDGAQKNRGRIKSILSHHSLGILTVSFVSLLVFRFLPYGYKGCGP